MSEIQTAKQFSAREKAAVLLVSLIICPIGGAFGGYELGKNAWSNYEAKAYSPTGAVEPGASPELIGALGLVCGFFIGWGAGVASISLKDQLRRT